MGIRKTSDCICRDDTLTPEEKWERTVGTTANGNLPQYKRNDHTGHIWAPCPYDSNVPDAYTRSKLKLAIDDPLPTRVDHTAANGRKFYMEQDRRGLWGYVCTFDTCSYYVDNGDRYFLHNNI